jgi:hypothetical protein
MMALGRRVKPLDIGAVTGWARHGMKERSQHRSAETVISSDAQQGHSLASGRAQPSYFGSIRSRRLVGDEGSNCLPCKGTSSL